MEFQEPDNPNDGGPTSDTSSPDAPIDSSQTDDSGETESDMASLPDVPELLKEIIAEREQEIFDLRLRNDDLTHKLVDRDRVVQALTARLEQAAEQLDRLHRSGADRGGKLLSGIPSEVIDEQRELIGDLREAIERWEELQSSTGMARFETQLNELRDMLAQQLNLKPRQDATASPHQPPRLSGASAGQRTESSAPKRPAGKSGGSTWEQMKAQLLGDHSKSGDMMVPGAAPEPSDDVRVPEAATSGKPVREIKIEIKERPPAINIDNADHVSLQQAVRERDTYIDHLLAAIDTLKREAGVIDLEDVKKQKQELEEKLRKAEVEMSMERAKLAREAARIKQLEDELSPKQRASKTETPPAPTPAEEKGSRWKRFLGSK